MKHVNKIAAILALSLLSVGCNNESKINQITNGNEKVVIVDENSKIKVTDLQTLFDNYYYSANGGSIAAVDIVMQHIAELEVSRRNDEIATRIDEKLRDLAKGTTQIRWYIWWRILATDLKTGYAVTCDQGYSSDYEDLKCDYTDYKESVRKLF